MSPEHVRGLTVDARSDIFSFGCLLFEMLTGERPFRGATAADTMSAILNAEPAELADSTPGMSPGLDRIVGRCLEKDVEQRFHSAHDLAFALEAVAGGSGSTISAARAAQVGPVRRRWWRWLRELPWFWPRADGGWGGVARRRGCRIGTFGS
jgi:serine/threonine protein kinase